MPPTARAVRYIAAMEIAMRYVNRYRPRAGPGRNIREREIARSAREWCSRYNLGAGGARTRWSAIVRNQGAFLAVHPRLWNRRYNPWNRIHPYHIAVTIAPHGSPNGMPIWAREIDQTITLAELGDILNCRRLRFIRPGIDPVVDYQRLSARDLYNYSAIFYYLPQFMIELGCLWRR